MALVVSTTSKLNSGFTPTSIPGCILWLDADDPVQFTGGSTWGDKSGTNNTGITGAAFTTMPTKTAWGTRTAARFVKANSTSVKTTNAIPSNPCTYFMVARLQEALGYGFFMLNNVDGSRRIVTNSSSFPAYIETKTGNPAIGVISAQRGQGFMVCGTIPESGSYVVRTNGTQVGTSTFPGTVPSRHFFGSGDGPGDFLSCDIAEIIIYNTAVSVADTILLEGYLGQKWGLQSWMPTSHPYKSVPLIMRPFIPVDISGCALWLDGTDRQTLTLSGSNITTWADKSGNGRNAVQFGAATATYDTSGSRVVITSTNRMSAPVPAGTFASGVSMFVAFQKYGANTAYDTLVTRTSGPQPAPFDMYTYDNGATQVYGRLLGNGVSGFSAGYDTTTVPPVTRRTTTTVYGVFIGSSNPTWTESIDGTASTIARTGGYATPIYGDGGTAVYIGTRDGGGTTANVYIYEIAMFDRLLPLAQRQQMEGYLTRKWGLRTNLPVAHPYRNLIPDVPVFSPVGLSNCALWLDATEPGGSGVRTPSGQQITNWVSKGNTGNIVAVSQTTPSAVTSNFQGYPSLYFNRAPWYQTTLAFTNTTGVTWFVVYATTGTIGLSGPVLAMNGNPGRGIRQDGTSQMDSYTIHNGVGRAGSDVGSTNVRAMYGFVDTPAFMQLLKNGSNLTSNATAVTFMTNASQTANIGYWNDYFLGHIFEIIVYDAPLSTSDRQEVEGYLAAKWGLQSNLPNAHPYKLVKP